MKPKVKVRPRAPKPEAKTDHIVRNTAPPYVPPTLASRKDGTWYAAPMNTVHGYGPIRIQQTSDLVELVRTYAVLVNEIWEIYGMSWEKHESRTLYQLTFTR